MGKRNKNEFHAKTQSTLRERQANLFFEFVTLRTLRLGESRKRGFDMKKIVLLISLLLVVSCGWFKKDDDDDTPTSPSTTSYTASFTATTPSASSNYVKMEQKSTSGDKVTIAVKAVSIAEPAGGLAIDVTYDTTELEYVSATNGDMITGSTSSLTTTDNDGTVIISASDVVDASSTDNGTLFTIKFKGKAAGSGSVRLSNGALFNAGGDEIDGISWYGGTVTVQ